MEHEQKKTGLRAAVPRITALGVALVMVLGLFAQLVWALPTEARAAGTEVYMDTALLSAGGTGTQGDPVKTFEQALAVLPATGGTIVVKTGGKDASESNISIPAGKEVTVRLRDKLTLQKPVTVNGKLNYAAGDGAPAGTGLYIDTEVFATKVWSGTRQQNTAASFDVAVF